MTDTKRAARPSWEAALRAQIKAAQGKLLVLGIGNIDKGDDGAGILAARALRKELAGRARGKVRVLLGYETPESLTGAIRAFAPRLVVMIDAALGTRPPGEIFLVAREDIPDEGVTTHKISLRMLIAYLEETVGCRVIFIGIQAGDLELGRPASPAVARAARTAGARIAAIVRSSSA